MSQFISAASSLRAARERRSADPSPLTLAAAFLSSAGAPTLPLGLDISAFLASAAREGLLGLLHARVCATGVANQLPPALVAGLRAGAHRQVVHELAQRIELQHVVAEARRRGLDVLLMKGASLAYQVYPDPAWRVRADADLFIRAEDRDRVRACFDDLGYVCEPHGSRHLVTYQFHSQRIDEHGVRHLYDVHWKIANPQRFADAMRFDELAGDAVPLPLLGPHARGIGWVHALWLSCMHRAAHHYDRDSLVWLYDIHLLMGALDAEGVARFVALAERTGIRRICLRALLLARDRFGTAVEPTVLASLEAAPDNEPSTMFLRRRVRKVDVLIDDMRVLPGWRPRLTLLKGHLFPDTTYMRSIYASGSPAPILWLYARRIVSGASKWFRPD
jgi:hypothetical protein